MKEHLRVCVTFDIDQDAATGIAPERDQPAWNGLGLLPRVVDTLLDRGIPATAFIRCDHQIRETLGSALAIRDRCAEPLERLTKAGGETGWHPHLYMRSGEGYRPIREDQAACEQLEDIYGEASRGGLPLQLVRLGEAWHSPACMRKLDELGLAIDSTALPGRRRSDEVLVFDWEKTPNEPYYPSRADHRVPGADPLGILEVPISTAAIRTSYDREPLRRYLNPAFHSHLFSEGLGRFAEERKDAEESALVLVFHLAELLPLPADGLCAQSWEVFLSNLDSLSGLMQAAPAKSSYVPLGALARLKPRSG